jgi:YHS domain-containing protein
MKKLMLIAGTLLAIAFVCVSLVARADGTNSVSSKPPQPIPDLLTNCPVSGDSLGDMGKPYVFVYKGQEVKLCCPDCKTDFDKDPDKYIKLIRAADKPPKK